MANTSVHLDGLFIDKAKFLNANSLIVGRLIKTGFLQEKFV